MYILINSHRVSIVRVTECILKLYIIIVYFEIFFDFCTVSNVPLVSVGVCVCVCVVVLSKNSCVPVSVCECVCIYKCVCEVKVCVGFLVFKCAFLSPLSVLCAADLIR